MATNSAEDFDRTPDEETSSRDNAQKPDRSNWPTRLIPLSEEGKDEDVLAMTPGERMEMMRQLAVDAWAMRGVDVRNARMERHIVRVIRRGKGSAEDVDQQH
jgi:hypothetical protein